MIQVRARAGRETCGIILAGSHRWDRTGFDELTPRSMMPVAHVPLICHVLRWLRSGGVRQAVICANSASRFVRDRLGDGGEIGMELTYYEDWTPRGPAGCLRDAADSTDAERFVSADATILPTCDLEEVMEHHERSEAAATIAATPDRHERPSDGERLSAVGIYVMNREALEHVPPTGYQDLKEILLPKLYREGLDVRYVMTPEAGPRVSDADSYLRANAWALERQLGRGRTPPGYRRIGQALIHETAQAASIGDLIGPVLIGPRSATGPGAVLVGPTVIGADCEIESRATVCESVLWDGCRVKRGASVNHCVLGDDVEVESETAAFHAIAAVSSNCGGHLRREQYPGSELVDYEDFVSADRRSMTVEAGKATY